MSNRSSSVWSVLQVWILMLSSSTVANDFKSVPTTVKTFENETVLLPCYLDDSGPNFRVRWWRGSTLVGDSDDPTAPYDPRFKLWANSSLQVDLLRAEDTGDYTCEVLRPAPWSPVKQVHAIEVQFPAKVETVPASGVIEVRKGEEVEVMCKATGTPTPIVQWIGRGERLGLRPDMPKLKFKVTSRHLAGIYECIANNGVGDAARGSIRIAVQDAPEVRTESPWVHTAVGLRAQLDADVVFANPQVKTHWYREGRSVVMDSRVLVHIKDARHSLVFRNVRASDLGSYTFRAENQLGMANVHFRLSGVANPAIFKVDNSRNLPTATSFTLMWEVDSYSTIIEYNLWFRPYKPKPPQKDDGVYVKEKDDTWTKLTIPGELIDGPLHSAVYALRGLQPSTVYEALVTSRNRFGWSKPSSILRFSTEQGAAETSSTPDYHDTLTSVLILEDGSEKLNASLENSAFKNSESDSEPSFGEILRSSHKYLLMPVLLLVYNVVFCR